jgi:CheY-like chemotaxis protein
MSTAPLFQYQASTCRDVDDRPPLNILLGEGDPDLRRLLAFVLRADGHDVTEVGDGSEMLEAIASLILDGDRQQFDLIVSEHDLPTVPGLTILAGLRSRGRPTAFILITDHGLVKERARRLGAVILAEPLTVRSVRAAVGESDAAAHKSVGRSG